MAFEKLNEILCFIQNSAVPRRWVEAEKGIAAEREAVFKALEENRGLRGAYGFTSMLGPNDHKDMQPWQQEFMLLGHLVGIPDPLADIESRAILASKIVQLSNGGTGISPLRYHELLEFSTSSPDKIVNVDLDASYGSGDVVPAAWWVYSLWGEGVKWNPGDLISLINGDFISNAYACLVFEKILKNVAMFVNLTSISYKKFIPGSPANSLDNFLNSFYVSRDNWDEPPQFSVAQRDVFPILHAITTSLYSFSETLELAYSSHSGNPIFVKEDGSMVAKSQSSFLNLELSNCLNQMNSLLSQISSSAQRATEISCKDGTCDDGGNDFENSRLRLVQLPKVSEAYRIRISSPLPLNYSGSMSGGVEDLWDLNLMNSRLLLGKIKIFEKQLSLLEDTLNIVGKSRPNVVSRDDIWEILSGK